MIFHKTCIQPIPAFVYLVCFTAKYTAVGSFLLFSGCLVLCSALFFVVSILI